MSEKLLSEDLAYWRSERPDEWTMDRFIRNAKGLEDELAALTAEKKELVNGQEVLEIVDSCFHCYASSFRSDAKVEAQNLFAELIAKHGE